MKYQKKIKFFKKLDLDLEKSTTALLVQNLSKIFASINLQLIKGFLNHFHLLATLP